MKNIINKRNGTVYLKAGTIILCVSFIVFFTVLLSNMPPQYASTYVWEKGLYPSYWNIADVGNLTYVAIHNITLESDTIYDFAESSPPIATRFWVKWHVFMENAIQITHFHALIIDFPMYFISDGNIFLNKAEMLSYKMDNGAVRLSPVYCSEGDRDVIVYITDPDSTRNDVGTAWDEGTIQLLIGFNVEPSDAELRVSGFNLVMKLLTFNTQDIFGGDYLWVNTLILSPFLIAIGVVIVYVLASFIPFL